VSASSGSQPVSAPSPAAGAFADAIAWAQAHETAWPRDPDDPRGGWGVHGGDTPPHNRLLGPVHPRGPASGLIWRDGQVLAQWGEPQRVDLTFSVAKTYLALLAGVAHDRGLLPDVHEPVGARVRGIGFEGPHNGAVTWHQLLQQTSEWEGSVFGVPEQVDRWRAVQYQPVPPAGPKGGARPLQAPGSTWEYNDVRINQLSLALLHLFGRPLPEVFAETIARPVGASDGWRWVGYDNAWVTVDGRRDAVGARRHALGRRRHDQQPRSAEARRAAAQSRRQRGQTGDLRTVDRQNVCALSDRAVLRHAGLVEPHASGIPVSACQQRVRDWRGLILYLD